MKVLVVGGGGREHALVWKIAQSPKVSQIFCAPGNAGIAKLAQCVPIGAEEIVALADFAQREGIDLTVVGPEAPLCAGIVDEFQRRGLRIFGPTKSAAEIEGSKVFCRQLLAKWRIPSPKFAAFDDPNEAKSYIRRQGAPIVVKADGLAAGKGSIVCATLDEALRAVDRIMVEREFGDAGKRIVVEEFLKGARLQSWFSPTGAPSSRCCPPATTSGCLTMTKVRTQVAWALIAPSPTLMRRFTTKSWRPS